MSERLLRIEGGRLKIGTLRLGVGLAPHESALIAPELDRLYAAAEANQAPGPDWKAKLREQVMAGVRDVLQSDSWNAALEWALALIDALPDPPTSDPDAPPVYVPPEGHVAPVEGRNVPDGWVGRYVNGGGGFEWSATTCRSRPTALFEVRRVPTPEPATEWVPLHEALATKRVANSPGVGPFVVASVVRAPDGPVLAMSADGARYVHVREDGMVEVLAEGER